MALAARLFTGAGPFNGRELRTAALQPIVEEMAPSKELFAVEVEVEALSVAAAVRSDFEQTAY